MKRVLFVDDEQKILDGLQRLLQPRRNEWQMAFAAGGEAALKELAKSKFDVVVTDMRMPVIDGAQLLKVVQERHPNIVRIVLAGHSELEAALRSVPVAHQFLNKPVEPDVLKEVIDRASVLQTLLAGEAVRRTVGEMGELPSQPLSYNRLIQSLADPKVSTADIGKIVEGDVALCAKILHLVNSSFFGLARNITNIQNAVSYLGVSTLKTLALTIEVFKAFQGAGNFPGFSVDGLQTHAILTANIAKRLLPQKNRGDDAFIAGMLHDVGKLILASRAPDRFRQVLAAAQSQRRPLHEVERQLGEISHAELGAYLLGLWGLPYPVVEAVANHHRPRRVSQKSFDVLGAVYVANILAHEVSGLPEGKVEAELDNEYIASLRLESQLPGWRAMAAAQAGLVAAGA